MSAPDDEQRGRRGAAREHLEAAISALQAGRAPFTRGNLGHAVRRVARDTTEASFTAALQRRVRAGPIRGLLPEAPRWTARDLGLDAGAPPAAGVLLVDRPRVVHLLVASGICREARLAVVALDGTPSRVAARLQRGFRGGLRVPVLYLHDAATVAYPFTIEPLASLVAHAGDEAVPYVDLGLPPLGASPRRFGDPTLPEGELLLELEAIPPATLARHCVERAARLGLTRPGDPRRAP